MGRTTAVELATDAEDFRRLAGGVVTLVASLQSFGVDHREVLFHDVAQLAHAGKESQTFRELLEAFSTLLAAWSEAALDPTELLKTAVPAAAREAIGRPWVLAIALKNATRLVREGRAAEAVTLLEVGVKTATQLGSRNVRVGADRDRGSLRGAAGGARPTTRRSRRA